MVALVKETLMPLYPLVIFLHRLSRRFWPIDPKRLKIMLMLTESLQRVFVWPRKVWGKRTQKYTRRKKTGRAEQKELRAQRSLVWRGH